MARAAPLKGLPLVVVALARSLGILHMHSKLAKVEGIRVFSEFGLQAVLICHVKVMFLGDQCAGLWSVVVAAMVVLHFVVIHFSHSK